MQEIAASEFSFVDALPRREQKAVRTAIDVLNEWREASRKHGSLVPASIAAGVLNVSHERIRQYLLDGRLQSVDVGRQHFITETSLASLANTERKAGRPFKIAGVVKKGTLTADYLKSQTEK